MQGISRRPTPTKKKLLCSNHSSKESLNLDKLFGDKNSNGIQPFLFQLPDDIQLELLKGLDNKSLNSFMLVNKFACDLGEVEMEPRRQQREISFMKSCLNQETLIESHDINNRESFGLTTLFNLPELETLTREKIIDYFLNPYNHKINFIQRKAWYPLCYYKMFSEILSLFIKYGGNINIANKYGWNALAYDVYEENTARVELLLNAGANPDIILKVDPLMGKLNGQDQATYSAPLIVIAMSKYNVSILNLLLKAKADPNQKDSNGDTALKLSFSLVGMSLNGVEALIALLRAGATITAEERYSAIGRLFILLPSINDKIENIIECIELLLKAGDAPKKIKTKQKNRMKEIIYAKYGAEYVVKILNLINQNKTKSKPSLFSHNK